MSKSRTGRKGRVRLALAGALQDLDSAVGDASIVDADGRLGVGSGLRSDDKDKTNAQLLDMLQSQVAKPGSANALFQQGEVRGPLLDSVDTQNGASGVFGLNETANPAGGDNTALSHGQNIAGESTAAAQVPLSNGDGTFAHYVLPDVSEDATGDRATSALTAAAGGALANAGARTSQISSTDAFGICYHQGGPGSDFAPLQHLGTSAGATFAASCISIEPTAATLHTASAANLAATSAGPTQFEIQIVGQKVASSGVGAGGDPAGAGGASASDKRDELVIIPTANTAAAAVFRPGTNSGGGAGINSFEDGASIVIRDDSGVIMTIKGTSAADANRPQDADNNDLLTAAEVVGGDADGAGTKANGANFYHSTASGTSLVYVISHKSVSGDTSYTNRADFVEILGQAIRSLATQEKMGLVVTEDGTDITLTWNKLRGAAGNAADVLGAAAVAGDILTVTFLGPTGQILVPAAGAGHDYWESSGSDTAFAPFASGVTGTNFDGTATRIASQTCQVSHIMSIHDLPVRVAYLSNANAKRDVSSGKFGGVGSAVLDTTAMVAAGDTGNIVFTIPQARGGKMGHDDATSTTTIRVVHNSAADPAGEGNNIIAISAQGLNADQLRDLLVETINGGQEFGGSNYETGAGNRVHLATASSNGAESNGTSKGGFEYGVYGVKAERDGAGKVRCYLHAEAEGFADDGSADCTVAVAGGLANGVRSNFSPAGQVEDSSRGFAIIWGPIA